MAIQLIGGDILIDSGSIAMHADCCCSDECTEFAYDCDDYFDASTRGIAGTQPSVTVTIDDVDNVISGDPCANDCENCDTFYNEVEITLAPCTCTYIAEEDAIDCDGGGLASGSPGPSADAAIFVQYWIEIQGTETIAFLYVQLATWGSVTCANELGIKTFKWHEAVTNPTTWKYPSGCGDDTKDQRYPGQITGTWTSGWGSYTPNGGAPPTYTCSETITGTPYMPISPSSPDNASKVCDLAGASVTLT